MNRFGRAAWLPALLLLLASAAPGGTGSAGPGNMTPANEADLQRGQDLLQMAVAATGSAALLSLKDFTYEESGVITLQGADRPVRVTTTRRMPDCLRTDQKVDNGSIVQVICGDQGWVQTPDGTQDLTPEQIKAQKGNHVRDLLNVLRHPSALRAEALRDTATVDGKPAAVLAVQSELVKEWKIYLDRASHRIVRMEYQDLSPATGKPALRQETFSSYVPVSGLYWPQTRTILLDGAPLVVLRIVAAKANTNVSSALFEKPTKTEK